MLFKNRGTKWLPLPHEVVTKKTLSPNEKTAIKTLSINIDKCELSNVKFINLEEDLCVQEFRKRFVSQGSYVPMLNGVTAHLMP
jgi:hypothetical protein